MQLSLIEFKLRFSVVFKGYRIEALVESGLITSLSLLSIVTRTFHVCHIVYLGTLNHFQQMFHFYQKTGGFLKFSRGVEVEN